MDDLAPAHVGTGDPGSGTGDLTAEVAALQQLDAPALRRHWRVLVGGAMPADLSRPLLLRVLAYRLQAQRLGDLDMASLRALAVLAALPAPASPAGQTVEDSRDDGDHDGASRDAVLSPAATSDGADAAPAAQRSRSAPLVSVRIIRPGTVLLRKHTGVAHRVTVLADGFGWNGRTYDSLSQIAFAITGTKWNGTRFFGLRDKPTAEQASTPPSRSKVQADVGAVPVVARRAAPSARGAAP